MAAMATSARHRFLLSRSLLRTALSAWLGVAPHSIPLTLAATGKPRLAGGDATEFNVSHSATWVAVALSRHGAVGVDVEHHRRRNNLDAVARRYFDQAEYQALCRLAPEDRNERFFSYWTFKEAYVKALGCGLAPALAHMRLRYGDPPTTAWLEADGPATFEGSISGWQWRLGKADTVSLVVLGSAAGARLIEAQPSSDGFAYRPLATMSSCSLLVAPF